ncbi:MAG: type II secretion system major pseudopilin GspG [Bdellovibrionales bacterium]|nr:type II secretion system major pseudopilin GspG [Bdellovibrionales bacterium]
MKLNTARYTKTLNDQAGFSLIEIMIVVMIMGILVGLVGPKVMSSFSRAKVDTTTVQMKQLATMLKNYRLDCNLYPTTDQGLDALVQKPTGGQDCRNYAPGGYTNKIPKDGWDKDFLYESDGTSFTIKSLGADMKPEGKDYDSDISVTDKD